MTLDRYRPDLPSQVRVLDPEQPQALSTRTYPELEEALRAQLAMDAELRRMAGEFSLRHVGNRRLIDSFWESSPRHLSNLRLLREEDMYR